MVDFPKSYGPIFLRTKIIEKVQVLVVGAMKSLCCISFSSLFNFFFLANGTDLGYFLMEELSASIPCSASLVLPTSLGGYENMSLILTIILTEARLCSNFNSALYGKFFL